METDHLKEFLVLAGSDSYYNAASASFISSSALSKHIHHLEELCGQELLDHRKRTILLTPYGEIFKKYAQQIIDLETECFQKMEEAAKGENVITVGTIRPQMEYHFMDILDRFETEVMSSVHVELVETDSLSLMDALEKDKLKFALVENREGEFISDGRFEIVPFCRDYRCVLLPESHPFAGLDLIPLESLKDEAFITFDKGSHACEQFMQTCHEAGFEPRVNYYVSRDNDIWDMVSRGKGIALVTEKPINYYLDLYPGLRMIRYTPQNPVNIDFIFRKDAEFTEAEKALAQFIAHETADTVRNL